jgi:chitinase
MKEYIEFIRNNGYDEITIEIVKRAILIAEQYISTPNSQRILPELIKEVNKIYKNNTGDSE